MSDGLMLASPVQHPLRLSPEQPDQKPHLGRLNRQAKPRTFSNRRKPRFQVNLIDLIVNAG
jgi:hypothetical protein